MKPNLSVNGFLTSWAQNRAYVNRPVEGTMIHWLRNLVGLFRAQHDVREREQHALLECQTRKRETEQRNRRERDDAEFFSFIAATEATRRAFADLSRDVDDAITVVRQAYKHAVEQHELLREALEGVHRRAIVLADGRHVYFSFDGALYGEDCHEISDTDSVFEAQRLRSSDSPTFETYRETRKRHDGADERVRHLSHILEGLDELKQRQADGTITTEALTQQREDLNRILESLPSDLRADLDRLRVARHDGGSPTYQETELASITEAQVAAARASFAKRSAEIEDESMPARNPAYTNIPSF